MSVKTMLLVATVVLLAASSMLAANIVIVNGDGAGEGFNDPTPVAAVGGNAGTTIGQQRLNVFQYVAGLWGARLTSPVNIVVLARFNPLSCNATAAVLGSAGPAFIFANFPNARLMNYWYPGALADKQAGIDLIPGAIDLVATFNSSLGNPGCLTGSGWYYGLDSNHASRIDLVSVVLHEFGHGLGFLTVTNPSTGAFVAGRPSIFDRYLFDSIAGQTWDVMSTNAQRAASAINTDNLSWIGPTTLAAAPTVLSKGVPRLQVNAPADLKGDYRVGGAAFGPPVGFPSITGELGLVLDGQGPSSTDGCEPLTGDAAQAVKNKIAFVERGTCTFTQKVLNAQAAGARAVVIADNVAGSPPPVLGGTDPNVSIPAVRVTLRTANSIKAVLSSRWPASSGVNVSLGVDHRLTAGLDTAGRVQLWAPNPVQPGSSVSHWDTIAFPNLLMEPFINPGLTQLVGPPRDLTLPLLIDIGW